jgi:uncharacterized protein (TIGR00251 family)
LLDKWIDGYIKGALPNNPPIQKSINPIHSTQLPGFLHAQVDGVLLSVKVQPRASANEIMPYDGTSSELRIRITAPPVEAAANEALVRFLAGRLDCPRHCVELVRGHKSRHKVVKLHGFKPEEVRERL